MDMKTMHDVVVLKWIESESGWGVRSNGCSLHLTHKDRKKFVKDYWDKMPETAPEEYTRPTGDAFVCKVDSKTLAKIKASKNGVRCYDFKIHQVLIVNEE
jgi:hypothetical protein